MTLLAEIAAQSLLAFGLVLLLAQVLAREVGYWFGRWSAAGRDGQGEGVGVVVGALLGLLAFVLALTLSFSSTRFTDRRATTLSEANAIGTAWLRAEAIGHARGAEIARLLEDYTRVRASFVQAPEGAATIEEATQRTAALQTEIWGHLSALVRERTDPVAVALAAALNETFDMSTTVRFAFAFRLPPGLFWLLIGMALLGMGALGFQLGLRAAAAGAGRAAHRRVDGGDRGRARPRGGADRRDPHEHRGLRVGPGGLPWRGADPSRARAAVRGNK